MILKYLAFMLGGNMKEHMKRETEETISRRFGTCRYLIIGQVLEAEESFPMSWESLPSEPEILKVFLPLTQVLYPERGYIGLIFIPVGNPSSLHYIIQTFYLNFRSDCPENQTVFSDRFQATEE
jgi:hypothetical protein